MVRMEAKIDLQEIGEFLADCGMLYKNNKQKYNDAWIFMTPEEIAAGLRLKAARITAMLQAKSDKAKICDDLMDIVVYAYFLYTLLNGEK
jgi:hypothetical protein